MEQNYKNVHVKEILASPNVQNALKELLKIPRKVMIKEVRKPFKSNQTDETTQKVHAIAGNTITDFQEIDMVLLDCSIDREESINKFYEIIDYKFSLIANMKNGEFNGYSATGFKIIVTKIEKVKGNEK